MKRLILLLPFAAITPAMGQRSASPPTSAVATTRLLWEEFSGYLVRAADQMPEANYAFKPTPEVRSFGQLIAHVAGSQNYTCGATLGETGGSEDDVERTKTTKADIVAALRASNQKCARAYAQTDAAASQPLELFGQKRTRLYGLIENAAHDAEHYGNVITYFRLKGMVPPSSQPQR